MLAPKIKRAISFVLSFLLLFQGSLPYSQVFAQEATESATPVIIEPTPEPTPTPLPEWQIIDGVDVTSQPVGEGHTYRYKDTAVSVTFTKVTQPGLLKIKEVAVGDATGYDITSDMPDGTFIYDLTLPNPNPNQEARVQYSEDGQTYQELPFQKQNDVFVIKNLNHFTIFVVRSDAPTNDGTSITNDASGGSVCVIDIGSNTCYQTIQAAVDAASPGDTINIADGTYTDSVTIDDTKTGITLHGTNRDGARIETGASNIGISLLSGANNIMIENLLITGNGDGISLFETSDVIIQNNTISNNAYVTSGIHIQDSTGVVITGNSFSGNDTDISNDSSADVNALDNDWGTFDGSAINDRIYDQLDDESLGLVQYDTDPPTVDAGSDVTTNTSFNQTGTASDTYMIERVEWSDESGEGEIVFDNPSAYTTNISANSDGEYTITFTAWDYQGNFYSDDFTLVWDTTIPVDPTPTSSSHTIEVWSKDQTIDVSWSEASDDTSGVDGYYTEWNQLIDSLINSVSKEYEEDASSETSPNRSTAQDHFFHIATLDNAGNWTSTAHLGPFWIDAANPTVSWASPANDAYLRGTVSLQATASDAGSGVEFVRFRKKPTGGIFSTISTDYSDPYSGSWDTTTVTDGTYVLRAGARDNSGRTRNADINVTVDNTPPVVSWTAPVDGQTISGSVDLVISATDATSGIATTEFSYQRQDGLDTFHITASPWDTSSLALDNYTLRVTVTDNAGNSTVKDETVGVAAVISTQAGATPVFGQIVISWTTDRPTSGRIVYDTTSHPVLGAAPNYDYAFSTDTVDASPKSTSHTIIITGLSDNTTYYWRTVSAGSPTAIGSEMTSRTFSLPGGGGGNGGGGGGGGGGTVLAAVARAAVQQQQTEETEEAVELIPEVATPTPTPASTPAPQAKGASTFNWWIVIIPAALLGLIISGLLLWRRP